MKFKAIAVQMMIYLAVVSFFLAATCWGSRAVSVISQEIPVDRNQTIVIDPGHGGEDGGAVSCTGVKESQINLQIALRLNDLFGLLGYRTRMIRTTDTSVYTAGSNLAQKKVSDLKERVRMVGETENAVLISIHQNTYPDSRYSGGQIFYAASDDSRELADTLQLCLSQTVNPGSKRRSKRAEGVYLMEKIHCTGVLVECGFLSNPREEGLLRTGSYQQKIAAVVAAGVSNFLDGQTND